jgi:adenylyltransferase/sulfurtransferase
MKRITAHELKIRIDKGEPLQIIDIRDPLDHEVCHIPKAICIPKKEIFNQVDKIARDIPVVIYCRYGTKSPPLIMTLESEHGFRNIYTLEDGIYEWAREIDRQMLDLI